MSLHRDIYWLGRQWAVTGYGIQAVDQKRLGQYDVEAARIEDDDVLATLEAFGWFDVEDFREASISPSELLIRAAEALR